MMPGKLLYPKITEMRIHPKIPKISQISYFSIFLLNTHGNGINDCKGRRKLIIIQSRTPKIK